MAAAAQDPHPSLAQNCGAFFGHILKAIRTPVRPEAGGRPDLGAQSPAQDPTTIRAVMHEQQVGDQVHRRIVIDQVLPAGEEPARAQDSQQRNEP